MFTFPLFKLNSYQAKPIANLSAIGSKKLSKQVEWQRKYFFGMSILHVLWKIRPTTKLLKYICSRKTVLSDD
jgi:hypothetical protein